MAEIDSRQFRNVIGRFATGVTVLTVKIDRRMRGMTANAFCSLSLHPPLVLACIDRSSSAFPMFEMAEAFGVSILASDQQTVSRFFAEHGEKDQPMGGIPHRLGPLGSPLIDGAIAWAECRITERYSGGDHVIIIGRVEEIGQAGPEAEPLLFYGGKYRRLGEPI